MRESGFWHMSDAQLAMAIIHGINAHTYTKGGPNIVNSAQLL